MNDAAAGRREVENAATRIRRCSLLAAVLATFCLCSALSGQTGGPQVVQEGTLEVLAADDFNGKTTELTYRLRTDAGQVFQIQPPAGADFPRRTGARVRVTGLAAPGLLTATRVESLSTPDEDRAQQVAAAAGTKRVLVMLVNFQDDASQPYTP